MSDTQKLNSMLNNNRKLPAITERKRVSVEDCSVAGNPYLDVDEGIEEEVRIFNDVLGLVTHASCEGHLFKKRTQATIHSRVNMDQFNLIKKVVYQNNMIPIKRRQPRKKNTPSTSNPGEDYCTPSKKQKEIFEKKFIDSSVRFEYKQSPKMKNYYGIFSVRIIPKYNPTQKEWDQIRQERFTNVIQILYGEGLRKAS